jgi:hypothetical protein
MTFCNLKRIAESDTNYKNLCIKKKHGTLQAVSNPKLVGTSLHFRSPSIVLGHPITRVFRFFDLHKDAFD